MGFKESIDELLREWGKDETPGVAAAVLRKGEIVYEGFFGLADSERRSRIGVDTVFELASVTKPITALAVMLLRERNLLSYESPLSRFFPEVRSPVVRDITVRQLLTHTSALPEYDELFLNRKILKEKYAPRSIKAGRAAFEPTSEDVLRVVAELDKLEETPGKQFSYSNTGYALLSQVIARATKSTYHDFVQQEIFKPFGMSDSFVFGKETKPGPNFAVSYDRGWNDFHDIDYTPLNFVSGDGSARSTLADMIKLAMGLDAASDPSAVGGPARRIISPSTFNEATDVATLVPTDLAKNTYYGFGWIVSNVRSGARNRKVIWHTGMWTGFKTAFFRVPEEALTIILLSNIMQFPPSTVACNIANIFFGDPPSRYPPPAEAELIRFAKLYSPEQQFNPYDGDVDVTLEPESETSPTKILWLKTPELEKFRLTPVRDRGGLTGDFFGKGLEGFDLFRFSFTTDATPDPITGDSARLIAPFSPPRTIRNKRGFRRQQRAS